jgi:hypothetical protein
MDQPAAERPWVDLSTYAERTRQRIDSVRTAVRRGRLKARKGNDGRWLVPLPPLPSDDAASDLGSGLDPDLADDLEVAALRAEVERWRTLAEERGEKLARAEERAEAAKAVAIGDVEAAKRAAEETIAAKGELIEELKAMLAEARKPWWRRWIR